MWHPHCPATRAHVNVHTLTPLRLTGTRAAPLPPSLPPTAQEPATAELAQAFEAMKDMGVLMGKGGLWGNVFRIKPPMCFSRADADFLVDAMDLAVF